MTCKERHGNRNAKTLERVKEEFDALPGRREPVDNEHPEGASPRCSGVHGYHSDRFWLHGYYKRAGILLPKGFRNIPLRVI
jgi:hypothetical protein